MVSCKQIPQAAMLEVGGFKCGSIMLVASATGKAEVAANVRQRRVQLMSYVANHTAAELLLAGKELDERLHSCECGAELDRDHTASLNIHELGTSLRLSSA
jgi:hypothetical protein